jgi:predicted transcriptional regulator
LWIIKRKKVTKKEKSNSNSIYNKLMNTNLKDVFQMPPHRQAVSVSQKPEIHQKLLILLKSINMKREKVIDTIKDLPQEFELEELLERLVFVEKVESGLKQLETGKVVPHDRLKEIVKKW